MKKPTDRCLYLLAFAATFFIAGMAVAFVCIGDIQVATLGGFCTILCGGILWRISHIVKITIKKQEN